MNVTYESIKSLDGFISNSNSSIERGLSTSAAISWKVPENYELYDVVIVGAGFAGLIAARELSLRGWKVLIIEARDRIGGRTFTAQLDNRNFEIGGTWIHWSQPHVWAEMTRYGFTLTESKGATADRISVLLDNGARLKQVSMASHWSAMAKSMETYSDIDGMQGRTIMPLSHSPLTNTDSIKVYDQMSMKDRYDQVFNSLTIDDEINQMLLSLLSMNMQGDINDGGFIDHLRWWALGDYDMSRMFAKLGQYKIKQGTSALAYAILNDCQNVDLLLSTSVAKIERTKEDRVIIHLQGKPSVMSRTVIVTVPLNVLKNIEFIPSLGLKKREALNQDQCRGGKKCWVKLEKPIGDWFGFAPYPNPITMAYTDDEEGSIIVAFGPDDILDITNINVVERELNKLIPDVKLKYVLGHDWRNDPYVMSTWSWYKPGQMTSSLLEFQKSEEPIFFASGDIADGWRGFIDGAIESGLVNARHVQKYLERISS